MDMIFTPLEYRQGEESGTEGEIKLTGGFNPIFLYSPTNER